MDRSARRGMMLVLLLSLSRPERADASDPPSAGDAPTEAAADAFDGPGPKASPTASAPNAVPESVWRAVHGATVSIQIAGGVWRRGKLLSAEGVYATLVLEETGEVRAFPKSLVSAVRMIQAPSPVLVAQAEAEAAIEQRHVGLSVGIGNLMLDADYHPFYGFLGTSFLAPALTSGGLSGAAVGLGGSWRTGTSSTWSFDLYAVGTINRIFGTTAGTIGAGVGFHATWPSGLTVSVKLPVIGLALGGGLEGGPIMLGLFYGFTALHSPVIAVGYLF